MKIRIKAPHGEYIYDSDNVPIIVEFTEDEKEALLDMGNQNKMVSYPQGMPDEVIEQWMHQ